DSDAFGSISCGNTHFFSTTGHTGLFAPDIDFRAHLRIHDITAADTAVPVLLSGSVVEIGITGGSLEQFNGAALQVGDAGAIRMMDGGTSHGALLPRQTN